VFIDYADDFELQKGREHVRNVEKCKKLKKKIDKLSKKNRVAKFKR
jgi:hypothetical protein